MGKAVVVGLGRSGVGAANLLRRRGYNVAVTDTKSPEELTEFTERLDPRVQLALGGHPNGIFNGSGLVVVSPGVSLDIAPLMKARESGVEIISELELAYRELGNVPWYAVTGTNGKSTTVVLLNLILTVAGKRPLLGGNIGNALTDEIMAGNTDMGCVVAEVSSFQLEAISEFRSRVASVLNITSDHLDRYSSMKKYREAKARISLNQRPDDYLVLNADDPECRLLFNELNALHGNNPPRIFWFSRNGQVNGIYEEKGQVFLNIDSPRFVIDAGEMALQGVHNLENAMAAVLMAVLAGCEPDVVMPVLREFRGLPHRLEFVRELDGVSFVNDSKGTNVGAVVKSLEGFKSPVVLIAGGRDKKGDFTVLSDMARDRVKAAVLIGEASGKISAALSGVTRCITAGSLREAVETARGIASPGDVVLLSPACASFDMFRDFEDRGTQFKEIVNAL